MLTKAIESSEHPPPLVDHEQRIDAPLVTICCGELLFMLSNVLFKKTK
jgi:hypothetical protein